MKIHLPNSAFLGNIDPFLRSFEPGDKDFLEVTTNKKWISVHPVVLSMVAALGSSVKHKPKISFDSPQAKSGHYLERMGLFKILGIESGMSIEEHEPSGRFVPLTRITGSNQLSSFIREMVPLLHVEPEQAAPIKYVISELVRNVFEHAQSKHGAIVCAQFYRKTNRISIGVADAGVGIRRSISKSHTAASDLDAIKLALTPGITGATSKLGGTDWNMGAGLFYIKSMAKVNRNFFVVYSGSAMYKLFKAPSKRIKLYANPMLDKCSVGENFPYWQGTAVGVDISMEANQRFDALLEHIGKVFDKEIQEMKRRRFRRARFI